MLVFLAGLLGTLAAVDLTSALEGFLWGAEPMAGFVQGSREYYHYELVNLMNQGLVNTSQFQNTMLKYASFGPSSDYQTLRLRSLLKKWDSQPSPNEKTSILKDLSSYVSHNYSDSERPVSSYLEELPSELPLFDTTIPQFVYTSLSQFEQLTPAAYPLLETQQMNKKVLVSFLAKAVISEAQNLPKALADTMTYEEVKKYLGKMTVEQLEEYGELRPEAKTHCSFANAILRKKHPVIATDYRGRQRELRNAHDEVTAGSYCKSIEKEILYRLLTLGLYTQDLSESEFQRYLRLQQEANFTMNFDYLKAVDQLVPLLAKDILISEYEDYYFSKEDPEFSHYLVWYSDKDDFRRKTARAAFLSGGMCSDSSLPADFMATLASTRELEFDRSNALRFSIKDGITLKIRRKNVSKIVFKVISIDSERYYRTNLTPIPADLLLDGVEATLEKVIETPLSPLIRTIETVSFPELAGKEGLFVVEVMGGGLHARAWIQKGGLQRVTVQSEAGYKVYIYSVEGELRKSEHTGVLIDGKIYLQQADTDYVLVPWETATVWKTVVLLSDNLTQYIGQLRFTPPQFVLKAAYHLETEALRPKQRAFAVVTPQLSLNGHILALTSLSSIHAKVTVIQGSYQEIIVGETEIELSSGSFSVPFTLPTEFSLFKITLSAVPKSHPDLRLSVIKNFDVKIQQSKIYDLYLRKTPEEYELHILGKNGEIVSGHAVEIVLTSIYYKGEKSYKLASGSGGVIRLGNLEKANVLLAKIENSVRSWTLSKLSERVSYPHFVTMQTSSSIQLPIVGTGPCYLLTMAGDAVVKSTELNLDQTTRTVALQSLKQGKYKLRLPDYSERITVFITVLAGKLVLNDYVSGLTGLVALTQSLPLGISLLEVRQKSVKVQLSGKCQDAHLIISLRQFVGSEVPRWTEFSQMRAASPDHFPYPRTEAKYLESRLLDEEYLYVLDRKQASDKQGISFPSPSLLIHPDFVRGTDTEKQIPQEGTTFEDPNSDSAQTLEDEHSFETDSEEFSIGSFLDFLTEPALVLTNLKIDANCAATIGISQLRKYALVEVMAVNNGAVAVRREAVPQATMEKRTLTLESALPSEGGFAEVRSMEVVHKGQERDQLDSENASWVSIDTLGKLLEVLKSYKSDLSEWMFLSDWGLKTVSEKLSLYEQFASNELNFFLYHKDLPFFSTYVKPLVMGKMEKTLLDDIILHRPLDKYLTFPQVSKLSALEKALLAQHAPELAAQLKARSAANQPSVRTVKELFDHALKDSRQTAGIQSDQFFRGIKPMPLPHATYHSFNYYSLKASDFQYEWASDYSLFARLSAESYNQFEIRSADKYKETQYLTSDGSEVAAQFWFSAGERNSSFLTDSVLFAHNSVREAQLAVALTDLPWTSTTSLDFGPLSVPDSSYIQVKRAIQSVPLSLRSTLAVTQFYLENNAEVKELVKGRTYAVKVVLSNLSQQSLTVEVLMQIPQGSLSLNHRGTLLSNVVELLPYSLQELWYDCYFPTSGQFIHAGVYVAQDGIVIQRSPHIPLQVLEESSLTDISSFPTIAASGNLTAVLFYLTTNDLESLQFHPMLWLLADKEAFLAVTTVLRSRLVYKPEVWAYSLLHQSEPEMREFLSSDPYLLSVIGPSFRSSLLSTEKNYFQYSEYFPLSNPRWHPLQGHSRIANRHFRATYESFLRYLAYKGRLDSEDRLILAQYFVMQHRYQEARHQVAQIADLTINTDLQMQLDYLQAYLNSSLAHEAILRYNETASLYWKEKWEEMGREIEAKQNSYSESLLSAELTDSTLSIYSENIAECQLKVHKIDLELLFSRSPFLKTTPTASSYTAPSFTQSIALVSGFAVKYSLPESLQLGNLMLFLDCGGQFWSGLYAKSGLRVQIYSSKGTIRVTDVSLEGVAGAYVKVYAKNSGKKAAFYKDGYTDSKGKFSYSTVTSDEKAKIAAFSLLVTHEELGSTVLEISSN